MAEPRARLGIADGTAAQQILANLRHGNAMSFTFLFAMSSNLLKNKIITGRTLSSKNMFLNQSDDAIIRVTRNRIGMWPREIWITQNRVNIPNLIKISSFHFP